ncbi:AAA family ATPase [Fusobacterium necrophorum]|uniref:9-O-acetyl-N-acetylneuraminate esterase n=1 Tax=Fusobacterium necrophorum DJ-2 TaxID=1441737 RepID=A0AB73C0H6_9FUSO|nr:AAA family ATPase [Fusobacterium necrophorum]KDE69560.1 9-O-acetyl-N-acetylneuraminate esterase [Fusobacterium necrophorum DJ-2]MCF0162660.1 AAA family ATPase [Fusobacterium necrophorum]
MFSLKETKGLPNGISNFKVLREKNYYYVDKTAFIEELQQEIGKTILFTRPRRFGKTLNMSMLQYFWDIQNTEENRKLFRDLEIENSPYMAEQGKYPVIYLSFKDLKSKSWEDCLEDIKLFIQSLFYQYRHILPKLDSFAEARFSKCIHGDSNLAELKFSLKFLTELLSSHYQIKVVLLIDEYDTPIISAYENGYYEEAISFFRTFYSAALKDNEYLQIGIMTGILRVAKEGIFSGLNNLTVYSILDEKYSSYFGLTEEEVEQALKYYHMEYNTQEVKEWYNGYQFGNTEIYNPWSIINYISNQKLDAYWINTSSNGMINQILEMAGRAGSSVFQKLEILFQQKTITQRINKGSDFHDLVNMDEVWQLFLHSGYLTVDDKEQENMYELRIPNKEVHSFFQESFIQKFLGNYTTFHSLIRSLENGKVEELEQALGEILLSSVSHFDLSKESEKFYHVFIIGLVAILQERYYIKSNRESGEGRYDLSLEPRDRRKVGLLLEFKVANSEGELDKKAKEALEQIESKKYATEMKERDILNILGLGIAFYGKKVKIARKSL